MTSATRWIVYGFLAAATLAVLAFPSPEESPYVPRDHYTKGLFEARQQWIVQSEALRRAQGREIARSAVASLRPSAGAAYEITRTSDAPAMLEQAVRRTADATYSDLPRRDSTIRLVIVAMVDTGPTIAGAQTHRSGWSTSTDTYFPGSVSSNTCVIVVRSMGKRPVSDQRIEFADEPCYWYKAYGLPGKGVTALLDSTRHRILAVHGRGKRHTMDDASHFAYAARDDARALKCVAGDLDVCESLMLGALPPHGDATSELRTPNWIGAGRYSWRWSDFVPGALLSAIEREMGPGQFHRLWSSDAPFNVAFAEANGQKLGQWIHDVLTARIPPYHRGPVPAPRVWLAAVIAIPGLIAIGTYGVVRRGGTG